MRAALFLVGALTFGYTSLTPQFEPWALLGGVALGLGLALLRAWRWW